MKGYNKVGGRNGNGGLEGAVNRALIGGLLRLFLAAAGKVLQEEYQWSVRESGRFAKLVVGEIRVMQDEIEAKKKGDMRDG